MVQEAPAKGVLAGAVFALCFLFLSQTARGADPSECVEKTKKFAEAVRKETQCFRLLDACKVKPQLGQDCLHLGEECLGLQAQNDKLRRECVETAFEIGADVEKEFKKEINFV